MHIMLPKEFINYSKKFKFGFLVTSHRGYPLIEFVNFKVKLEDITINNGQLKEGKACLVLANERYSENSIMANILGDLIKDRLHYTLTPSKVFWTNSFSMNGYPKEIINRWTKK